MTAAAPERAGLALARAAIPRGRLVAVLVLSVAGSLTEGLGLMMLVPMLGAMDGGSLRGPGNGLGLVRRLAETGQALGLPMLLVLFVLLIALRAALVQRRIHAEEALQLEFVQNLREGLLGDLLRARWSWQAQQPQARAMSLLLGTIDRVGFSLQQVQAIFAASATLVIVLAAALAIDPLPALVLGLGGALVAAVHMAVRGGARRHGAALESTQVALFGFMAGRLANLRLVKSFVTEQRDLALAHEVGLAVRRTRLAFSAARALGLFAVQAGTALVLGLTVWLAITRWHAPPAALLPLIAVSARAAPLLATLQAACHNVIHNLPGLAELGHFSAEARGAAEPADGQQPPPRLRRAIALERATVRHPGRDLPALDAVTVELAAGSTVLLTGPSGAGKSTLADLLSGLIAPDDGRLLIDGEPVSAPACRAWRGQVAYVHQEPILLPGSIRENLLWAAPEASEAELEQALRDAAAGFVFALPQGLDTVVGERGMSLSGGERQRIALARGLLRRPDLLILDEVTSALDAMNEAAVAEAMAGLRGRMTIVIIGHRGALAGLADRRLTLEAGKVIGDEVEIASQFVAGGTPGAMKG